MNGEIIDSSSSVDVDAEVRFVGGLVGRMGDNTDLVLRSSSTGDVSSGSNSRATGGLVGESWGVINESYSTGDVSSPGSESGLSLDGGLVGESGFGASVNYVYATGNVSDAEDRKGGLFGSSGDASVEEVILQVILFQEADLLKEPWRGQRTAILIYSMFTGMRKLTGFLIRVKL